MPARKLPPRGDPLRRGHRKAIAHHARAGRLKLTSPDFYRRLINLPIGARMQRIESEIRLAQKRLEANPQDREALDKIEVLTRLHEIDAKLVEAGRKFRWPPGKKSI